jgi:hypothetical protein
LLQVVDPLVLMVLVHEDVALGDWGAIPSIEHILQCAVEDERDPLLVGLSGWARPAPEDLTQALQFAKTIQRELGWTDRVLDKRYKPLIPKHLPPQISVDNEAKGVASPISSPVAAKSPENTVITSAAPSPLKEVPAALSKALAELTGFSGLHVDVSPLRCILPEVFCEPNRKRNRVMKFQDLIR